MYDGSIYPMLIALIIFKVRAAFIRTQEYDKIKGDRALLKNSEHEIRDSF
jgi:hypothetical protein